MQETKSEIVTGNFERPELPPPPETNMALFYGLGLLLGIGCGFLHVALGDPLLTPLAVLSSTMLLGVLRPAKPLRWILVIGLPVPIVTFIAIVIGQLKVWDRALIAGAILSILVGCAGSIGGSLLRRFFENVFRKH